MRTMKYFFISIVLTILFYRSPRNEYSDEEINEYERLFEDAVNGDGLVQYSSLFPKQRFIQYISKYKDVLLHGSNNGSIQAFEPRRQTLYNGQYVDAVFATKDGIWPLFFAVIDRSKLQGSIRNACLEFNQNDKFYFFSINKETSANEPWMKGTIYFLPLDTFKKTSHEIVSFDEWISKTSVVPLARVDVGVEDFYFHNKVSVHKNNESQYKTWLMYKTRNIMKMP